MLAILAITHDLNTIVLEDEVGLYFSRSDIKPMDSRDILIDKQKMKWRLLSATSKYNYYPVCYPEFIRRGGATTKYLEDLLEAAVRNREMPCTDQCKHLDDKGCLYSELEKNKIWIIDEFNLFYPGVGVSRKRKFCPRCNSRNVVQIIFGYPTRETEDKARRGEIVLGGCEVERGHEPQRFCKECRYEWRATEPKKNDF